MNARVAAVDELNPSTVRRVTAVDSAGVVHAIALVRIEDSFYALADSCSHADISLSDGIVWDDECRLECPKHGAEFNLLTGEAMTLPATKAVLVYEVVRNGRDLEVVLP